MARGNCSKIKTNLNLVKWQQSTDYTKNNPDIDVTRILRKLPQKYSNKILRRTGTTPCLGGTIEPATK